MEQAKIDLSAAGRQPWHSTVSSRGLALSISGEGTTLATRALVEQVGGCVGRLLDQAVLRREQVDTIYFTGGASAWPSCASALPPSCRQRAASRATYTAASAPARGQAARRYG